MVVVPLWYLSRLAKRLRGSPASVASRSGAHPSSSPEELDSVSYKEIDMLKAVPPATHAGYAVVGGSGFLGTYVSSTGRRG